MSHRMIDARIVRWVDADTVVLELDVWPTIKTTEHVRLEGYDAPERGKMGADLAYARVNKLCPPGDPVQFMLTQTHKRSFVRYVGNVWPSYETRSVSQIMIAEHLSKSDFA